MDIGTDTGAGKVSWAAGGGRTVLGGTGEGTGGLGQWA